MVMVLKTSAVLVVPSLDTMLSEVITLVVKTFEVVVADVVGADVVVAAALDAVVCAGADDVVVSEALVEVVSAEVVVVVGAAVAEVSALVVVVGAASVVVAAASVVVVAALVADVGAVVSAKEVGLGLAVELEAVLVGAAADASDVDVACEESTVAELVLREVKLLDIVNGRLDVFLIKEGAMSAKTEDDNVICRETS